MATTGDSPIQASSRMRRHTMLPNHPQSIQSGSSPTHRIAYPSPPNSERAAISGGGVDIKKKPRAMSEMTSDVSGSMICDTCGKGYKHASCLSKHKWEHSPHWTQTSKLLISKHQQVQLLEAAQILVHMNRSDSSLSATSAGDRLKVEGYNYPVVFEDEDDMMDIQSDGQKLPEEDEEMFGMDD